MHRILKSARRIDIDVHHRKREICSVPDQLYQLAISAMPATRPQNGVPFDQLAKTPTQRADIERSINSETDRHVVGTLVGKKGLREPHPPLR
ncbi:Uncharacterised protein [Mycobacteroides abscessus subsp. abscessus]|nr:Uncharacterised protein [Mycobacteroides abscessus subsp. abscessus]